MKRTRNLSKSSQDSNDPPGGGSSTSDQAAGGEQDQDSLEADFSSGNKDTCVLEVSPSFLVSLLGYFNFALFVQD